MAKVWSESQKRAFAMYERNTGEKLTEEDKELIIDDLPLDEPLSFMEILKYAQMYADSRLKMKMKS
ncbi:MAG: hypothetical protein MJZ00_05290 [Paludibacteraceae bacterium]|nr:hypothetical protein [Paludibacteraceae bacterium]